jgi:hypothetical protein
MKKKISKPKEMKHEEEGLRIIPPNSYTLFTEQVPGY